MKFHNRENSSYVVEDARGSQKIVWESRSVAVNLVVLMETNKTSEPHVLVAKRGPSAADFRGKYNLIAGYLDWDETGTEAVLRECWEEVGLDLLKLVQNTMVLNYDLNQPWHVKTDPSANRQNVSLRYGVRLRVLSPEFPKLCLDYNEKPGEVELPQWMPVSKIDNYEWAFGHDQVIKDYLKKIN